MKRWLAAILLSYLFACNKPENTLDNPEYKAIEAHSWQSDSIAVRANGATIKSYSSAGNYEVFQIYFPSCGFVRYVNGQVADSSKYFLGYQPGRMEFAPNSDTAVSGTVINYTDIKSVTDSILVLEKHTSADSSAPVVTTYYHAQ